jgi:hypothetical protein
MDDKLAIETSTPIDKALDFTLGMSDTVVLPKGDSKVLTKDHPTVPTDKQQERKYRTSEELEKPRRSTRSKSSKQSQDHPNE